MTPRKLVGETARGLPQDLKVVDDPYLDQLILEARPPAGGMPFAGRFAQRDSRVAKIGPSAITRPS
jgi:hypothetical protein